LHENRELLNLIFQYSNDWEGYRDKNGKLIYCSLAFEQMLGYPVSDYLTDKIGINEFVHPDDIELTLQHFNRALLGETIPSLIIRYIRKNKNVIWVDVSARPVFSKSGEMLGVRYSSKDISKLKENELELEKLNATKDKFFSIISHDLKSPFTALMGLSTLLLEEHKLQSDDQREKIISFISEASKKTFRLLENLLAWARSQSGQLVPTQSKENLRLLLQEITDLLSSTAQNKKISLKNTVNDDIWVWVDSNILNTIIRNLISNSIKYTPEFGNITLSTGIKDGFAEVAISDTGVGFDDSLLNTMFKIGENISTPGTNNETGTGLGLILCKDFVEKLGGQIWAKSEIGKGSIFYFTIPIYKVLG
jgi:PAS domain S-box-containing protein